MEYPNQRVGITLPGGYEMFLNRLVRGGYVVWARGGLLLLLASTAIMSAQPREDPYAGPEDDAVLPTKPPHQGYGGSLNGYLVTLVFTRHDSGTGTCFRGGNADGWTGLTFNRARPVTAEVTGAGQDQRPKFRDLLRLDLEEVVELHFGNDARGAKAQEVRASASAVGIMDEGMTTKMLVLMLAASAADLASTEYALASGYAAEGNPLMQSRSFRMTTSLAVPVLAYLLTRKNPQLGKWVSIVHVGMHGSFAAWNVYTGVNVRWK
jgi:hypothetical protein